MKWGKTNERKSVLKKNSSKSFSESVKLNSEGASLEAGDLHVSRGLCGPWSMFEVLAG